LHAGDVVAFLAELHRSRGPPGCRRVERAGQLLQAGTDLPLAEVAACADFSDQGVFCHPFKRLVAVTPGRFRMSARIA
jgi:AraC-like DNA-binding protein